MDQLKNEEKTYFIRVYRHGKDEGKRLNESVGPYQTQYIYPPTWFGKLWLRNIAAVFER